MGQHTITIPARPFLRLTEADTGHIKETIRIHLEGGK
jgi:phage gpG-like protein